MIKVRFAPSPTGYLHIGGARTALFNWLYAKVQQGQFILRIEDTDQQRSTNEYEQEILDSMKWLGMEWDELYYQSERFDLYCQHAQKLVDEGKAYKNGSAILLTMPKTEIKFYDIIRGEISFDTANFTLRNEEGGAALEQDGTPTLKDEVLIKADGSPAYNFCCVVDDSLMEISTVIRGEDHISNTPRQIVIYQALGYKPPKFAHLPLIMGEDGGRLSKRTGAVAVTDYRKEGFLSEALVNYLMLLGWSPGSNQEMISLSSAIKKFSIKKVNKAAAVFSMDKLRWLNNQYVKQMDTDALVDLLVPFLKEKKYINGKFDRQRLKTIVELFKRRLTTLLDFIERADFFFDENVVIDQDMRQKHLTQDKKNIFALLTQKLDSLEVFDISSTEEAFRSLVSEENVSSSELVHPVRVALTGRDVGPGLFETMAVLGREATVKRLKGAFV